MAYTKNPTHREAGFMTAGEMNHVEEGIEAAAAVADNARVFEPTTASAAITAGVTQEASATKACIAYLLMEFKGEATHIVIAVSGKVIWRIKLTATAADVHTATFIIPAGALWEYKQEAGTLAKSAEVKYGFQK